MIQARSITKRKQTRIEKERLDFHLKVEFYGDLRARFYSAMGGDTSSPIAKSSPMMTKLVAAAYIATSAYEKKKKVSKI